MQNLRQTTRISSQIRHLQNLLQRAGLQRSDPWREKGEPVSYTHLDVYKRQVQIGFGEVTSKHVNKPLQGHFAKSDVAMKKVLREFRLDDCAALNVGDLIKADVFANGDKVDVCGTSKGKGYAGTIKRYGNHRLKETHGTGPVARHAGSNGACSDPSRVFKGKRLPGHMGAERVTVQNLEIVKVDVENNLIAIKGAIPGAKNGVVYITDSVKMA